jgi:hypothetical protein
MAETAHIRAQDRLDKELDFEFADRRLGMYLGFAALVALLCCGTIVIALGNVAIGTSVLGVAVLGTVIGTFINGRSRSAPEEKSSAKSTRQTEPTKSSLWKRIQNLISGT